MAAAFNELRIIKIIPKKHLIIIGDTCTFIFFGYYHDLPLPTCCVFTHVEVTCTHTHRHMGRNRINMHAFKCRPLITIYFPNQLRRLKCLLALGY